MESDQQIQGVVADAFASCPRPAHFTNHTHCEECAEHDATLQPFTPQSLIAEALGHAGWGPLPFMTFPAFAYFLPGLVRLALAGKPEDFVFDPTHPSSAHKHEWVGPLILSKLDNLSYNGPDSAQECLKWLTSQQQQAVLCFLRHLLETRAALIDFEGEADMLLTLIGRWSESQGAD